MTESVLDYLVIGAGPAGLQMAQLLQDGGYKYLVVEQGTAPGTFFKNFPRHRTLISVNKRHTGFSDPELNLRMDWNSLLTDDPALRFTRYSSRYFPAADDMVRYLADFAAAFDLRIRYDTRITQITRLDVGFAAADAAGRMYRARRVIVATGVSRPYLPDILGIETAEQYATVSVDPAEFVGQRVLIIGKGNSAFETAENLLATAAVIHLAGPRPLRLAWQTHFVGHVRAVNNNFLDTYQLKSQNAVLEAEVREIRNGEGGYLVTLDFANSAVERRYDRVIVCTGFRFDASLFDETCRPRLAISDRFPELTPAYESVNVPGLYFAGTITQQIDFKKSTNGFIHGFRYGVRALYRILEQRYHGRPWPYRALPADGPELTSAILARLNRSSALWQQFGVLGDLLTVAPSGDARYYDEVPCGYAPLGPFGAADCSLVVTLEYGPEHQTCDPFGPLTVYGDRDTDLESRINCYLHPVIRHYRDGELAATHHVLSDLENEWTDPGRHVAPLAEFIAGALSGGARESRDTAVTHSR